MEPALRFYPLFRDALERLSEEPEAADAATYLTRLEQGRDSNGPLLEMIIAADVPEKFYYRAKDYPFCLGGLGSALVVTASDGNDVLKGFGRVWEADGSIAVFGGFPFSGDGEVPPEWAGFNRFRFTLPLVEIRSSGGGLRIAVNWVNERRLPKAQVLGSIAEALQRLDARVRPAAALDAALPLHRKMIPEKPHWSRMVEEALRAIEKGELQKVVLARKEVITRSDSWDPARLLAAMARIEEGSYTFFYQVDDGIAFLGRSPERLVRVDHGRVFAEAIAGTRPRGKTPADDRKREAELLGSPKEIEEHRLVARFIEATMRRICTDVRGESQEEILKLKTVQHLITRFTGRIPGDRLPLTVAEALHPTPAVGGSPPERIPQFIKASEPFGRGWYAGPIGWMSKSDADFTVGIRSALVNRNELHIFAGAGIVKGSNAHDEWRETENKMDTFTAVLEGQ